MGKLIILEVNEVPFRIFDHYIQKKPSSTLSKILSSSKQFITKSTDQGELHPWSTWPTFYRGIDNTVHKIKDIGEDLKERNENHPPVWEILAKENVKTGVFASLHTYPLANDLKNYKFLIPDPFALGKDTYPKNIEPFQAFNLAMTRRSGRSVDKGIDKKSALRLLIALPGLGLRASTIFLTIKQLIEERIHPWKASRRRTFQSVLAFDIFLKQLKKKKPQFVTFFSNHVASAMHRYWAATFPEDYKTSNLPQKWTDTYKGEIDYCMDHLDRMVKSIEKFIRSNPEYKLIIASSMGQEATKAETVTHELFLDSFDAFSNSLSIEIRPLSAMHPQYNFSVAQEKADELEANLKSLFINQEPIGYRRKDNHFFSIDLGYPNQKTHDLKLGEKSISLEELGLKVKEIDDQSAGTAYHIPEGSFFVYDFKKSAKSDERTQVDLRQVAPSILNYFGVPRKSYMMEGEIEI